MKISFDCGKAVQTARKPKIATTIHWIGVKISEYAGSLTFFFKNLSWKVTNKAAKPTSKRHKGLTKKANKKVKVEKISAI